MLRKQRVRIFQTIPQLYFVVNVRKRLRSIWYQANQLGDKDQMDKAAKYHNWVAVTPDLCSARFMLHCEPEVG